MPGKTIHGAAIAYTETGSGEAVVLLHGFPLDGRIFEAQVERLAKRHRVIVPDLRGFGKSRDAQPFTIASLADDVHALLSEIGALPCTLGGLSMGGYVSLAFVKKYPKDVLRLMLIDTRAAGDTAEGKAARIKMIELLHRGGSRAVAEQMLPKMLMERTFVNDEPTAQKLRSIMENCPAQTIEHALLAMRDREDCTEMLPSIAAPTLILVGEEDPITPPSMAEGMHKAIGNSKLVKIENASHLSTMDQPDAVSDAIEKFLDETAF